MASSILTVLIPHCVENLNPMSFARHNLSLDERKEAVRLSRATSTYLRHTQSGDAWWYCRVSYFIKRAPISIQDVTDYEQILRKVTWTKSDIAFITGIIKFNETTFLV